MQPLAAQVFAVGALLDGLQIVAPGRGPTTLVGLAALAVLLALSAFFASSEIAIFSLGNHRISTLVEDGVPGAGTLAELKSNPRRLLVTILVGNNVANIAMASITTGLLAMYVSPGESVVISTFGVTGVVLLLGESAPKAYAVEHSESWALRIATPLRFVQTALFPLVEPFDRLTRFVNRLLGSTGGYESAYVTRAEVVEMIEAGEREGVFTEEEHRMLQRLLRFRHRIAKEAMVPRLDVVAVAVDADPQTAIDTCLESGYSQLPVYEDTLDTVVGVVTLRDLLRARRAGEATSLRSVVTEALTVPETKDVDDLLVELRAGRRRMAVVVDEFGTTAGVVTIEDIVEEIIGEVLAEDESTPIRWVDDRTALVRGEINVHAVNEALGTELPEAGEYESLAGLILDGTGAFPAEGETVEYDGVVLVVDTVDRTRILAVRVELPPSEDGAPATAGSESRDDGAGEDREDDDAGEDRGDDGTGEDRGDDDAGGDRGDDAGELHDAGGDRDDDREEASDEER